MHLFYFSGTFLEYHSQIFMEKEKTRLAASLFNILWFSLSSLSR